VDLASEQLIKASGVNEADPRVHEGIVLVEAIRAERIWWDLALGEHDPKAFAALAAQLEAQVDRAREVIAEARRKAADPMLAVHLLHYEQTLNTMVLVALARAGQVDRARGARRALRRPPPGQALRGVRGPRRRGERRARRRRGRCRARGLASASASAAPGSSPMWGEPRDYEFDHEPPPTKGPRVPGELELPATEP